MPPDFENEIEVKYAREFILPIAGLPLGSTEYTFDLGRKFFDLHADEEVVDSQVKVFLLVDKHENMIEFHFNIEGWLEVPCDRCADPYRQAIEGRQQLILKYGDAYEEESDEIIVIPADLHEFDVSHLIYEYVILMLPYRRIHPEDNQGVSACNAEVLRRLEQLENTTKTDPRWDALKKLNDLSQTDKL